jgi:hypothetical protein
VPKISVHFKLANCPNPEQLLEKIEDTLQTNSETCEPENESATSVPFYFNTGSYKTLIKRRSLIATPEQSEKLFGDEFAFVDS